MSKIKSRARTLVAGIEMAAFHDDAAGDGRQYLLSVLHGVVKGACDRIVMFGLTSRLPGPVVDFLQSAVETGTEVHLQYAKPEEGDGDDYIWLCGVPPVTV